MNLLSSIELEVKMVDICSPESSSLKAFQIIGYILIIIKILVPLIIIILGMIEFFKSLLSGDEKANSAAVKALINKVVMGVFIFFIPTILDAMLSLVRDAKSVGKNYEVCTKCVLDPNSSECNPKGLSE